MRGLGLLILRLAVGVMFIAHGLPKLVPVWGGRPADTAALLEASGVSAAYPVAVSIGVVEVLAGVLLVAGAYTVVVALLLTATTVATSWMFHLSNGSFLNWSLEAGVEHGYEFDFLRLSALVCVMLSGPGALAYDARSARERGDIEQKSEEDLRTPLASGGGSRASNPPRSNFRARSAIWISLTRLF